MKPADWKDHGWYSELFETKFLLAAATLLITFLAIEMPGAIDALRHSDAESISATGRLSLLLKVFATSLIATLLVAIPSRIAALLLFQPFEKVVQGFATLFYLLITVLLSVLAALSANATKAANLPSLEWLTENGPRSFRTFLILLWGFTLLLAIGKIISASPSRSARAMRMATVAALATILLGTDWAVSASNRYIAPENRQPGTEHNLTILVPELTTAELQALLSDPRLTEWKADLRLQGDVAGSSSSLLSQAVTLLTGLQPWEHGVRSDDLSPEEQRTLAEFIGHKLDKKMGQYEVHSLGSTTPLASILDLDKFELCNDDKPTRAVITLTENLFLVYSLLPDQIFSWFFPESKCTQSLASLTTLASQELAEANHSFRQPRRLHTYWWLDPRRVKNRSNDETNSTRLQILADTLSAFANNLELTKLRSTTRVSIVGITTKELGSFAIIAENRIKVAATPDKNRFRIGSAQLARAIKGDSLDNPIDLYQETLQESAQGTLGAALSRSVFYSHRTLYCAWGTDSKNTKMVRMRPTPSAIEFDSSEIKGVTIAWPLLTSEDECKTYLRRRFETILGGDVSLLNHRPLVSLLRKSPLFAGETQ